MRLTQNGAIVYCCKTMKRNFVIFILVCICLFTSQAQKKWTLKECIDYAVSQNILVKQMELQKQKTNRYETVETWTNSKTGTSLSMSEKRNINILNKYRLKTTFTVGSECIIKYSYYNN